MIVVVTGSRTWGECENAWTTMDDVFREFDPVYHIIREGEAPGADRMSRVIAEAYGFTIDPRPADWDRYGRSAGFKRNIEMLEDLTKHDQVVAFWDGISNGTQHTIREARKRDIPTAVIHGHLIHGAPFPVFHPRS